MDLLDAAIALAITLAALATTVTVLMEIAVRLFGLKSKTQVILFKKIFEQTVKDNFPGQFDRWEFINRVLKNPFRTKDIQDPNDDAIFPFFGPKSIGIYEWVSHEHVYRRLLSMKGVLQASRDELETKLKQFTRKYDELCAAASVEFKENRRRWSVISGILLAFVMNIDGIRIWNEYVKRPELAAAMAAKADELERIAQRAEADFTIALDNPGENDLATIEARVAELKGSIDKLEVTGLPIGWMYFPHCRLLAPVSDADGADKANICLAGGHTGDAHQDTIIAWISAILAILGTGVLIGLGAPFWFDVARRLADVRSFLGSKGNGDAFYNGRTIGAAQQSNGFDKHDTLIKQVVSEALAEAEKRKQA